MKKSVCVLFGMAIFLVGLHETYQFLTRERIEWVEGNGQTSPNQKWLAYLQTSSRPDPAESYSQLMLFDTKIYPELKQGFPNASQKKNPKASFLIPVQFFARVCKLKWSEDSSTITVEQGELNGRVPIVYELNVETFSLSRVTTDRMHDFQYHVQEAIDHMDPRNFQALFCPNALANMSAPPSPPDRFSRISIEPARSFFPGNPEGKVLVIASGNGTRLTVYPVVENGEDICITEPENR